ncbi:lysosome-associated membrane glycoprotein 2 isoform X1 [Centroberyx affinis]|uniref:lysosome-associated membrane glycoprotein 2 isoform X1 n=1 Tax=Centroberyx affinis TaxID=166261 RepID=UPI003A5C028B
MMSRCAVFVLFLALGIEIQLSYATEVSVKDTDDKLCLFANLMLNFSVTYEVTGNKNGTVNFELPENVTTEGSLCGNASSTLKLNFGTGHSWTVAFTQKEKTYQADSIIFAYNLSDSTFFPNAMSNETVTATVTPHITNVDMDTCYSCKSKEMFQVDAVNQTLWNALIQAFVSNGIQSENITSCAADLPVTTVAPTTHVTSTTTAVPATNSTPTTSVPTTTPTPTPSLPIPTTGEYKVKAEDNSTACLLANFGLRIGFKQGEKYQEMNFEPNGTKVSGSCGPNSSELVLSSNTITIMLSFTSEAKKFHLHALNVTTNPSSGVVFTDANNNLTLWEAAVGSSYMCNKKQNYNISSLLTLYTFDLRVQPFGVNKGNFSTAEDCQADADESFLVPIAVGVALLVLILIVLLAYFIGRKRNMASGYESF